MNRIIKKNKLRILLVIKIHQDQKKILVIRILKIEKRKNNNKQIFKNNRSV